MVSSPRKSRTDRLRHKYRPRNVRVLFLGEAPPNDGTFFYAGRSNLHDHTRAAFYAAWPELKSEGDFRRVFARLGCFIEDLSERPMPRDRTERRRRCRVAEDDLADRLKRHSPLAVVIVMSTIENHLRRALRVAGLADVETKVLRFPAYGWQPNYERELRKLVKRLRRRGAFAAL